MMRIMNNGFIGDWAAKSRIHSEEINISLDHKIEDLFGSKKHFLAAKIVDLFRSKELTFGRENCGFVWSKKYLLAAKIADSFVGN